MRILHQVNNSGRIGGVETYIYDLLPELSSYTHENIVVYHRENSEPPVEGIQSSYFIPGSNSSNQKYRHIEQIIRDNKPEVIYLHDIYDPGYIQKISQIIPVVGYVHIFYPVCPGLGKLFHRGEIICERPYGWGCLPMIYYHRCASARSPLSVYRIMRSTRDYLTAYRRLPRVVVGSEYMKQLLVQNKISEDRIECLPPHFVHPITGNLNSNGEGGEILFVGRLEYEKGLPYLLQVMSLVPESYRLLVVGDGSLKDIYLKLVDSIGLSERVRFAGWLSGEQLQRAYQQCSILVIPSIMAEPFGKVGIEAMNFGKPVVAFDVGGISDWLLHGENGYLVPVKDMEELRHRICQLLENRELRHAMGSRGRYYVNKNYQVKDHIGKLVNIFEQALEVWSRG